MLGEGWQIVALKQVATLQRGYDLPHRLRMKGTVPIITSSGVGDTHSEPRVNGPGVVTGRYGTIGEVYFVEEDFWPLNTTLFVKDFHGNDELFVSYLLRTIDFHSHSGKSGVPGVNRNDLHELSVLRPPLPEQRAIAAALSDVDALINSLDKLIAKNRDIKQGAMQQLLTGQKRLPGFSGEWLHIDLGAYISLQGGYSFRSENFDDIGIPVIRISDIQDGYVQLESTTCHPQVRINDDFIIRQGDILVAMSGATTGKVGVYNHSIFAYQNQRVGKFVVKDKNRTSQRFIEQLVSSSIFVSKLGMLLEQGAQPNISGKQIESLSFLFPQDISEQTAIATILSDMDAEIVALEQKRDKTRLLKQGMMQELLTGRIRLI